MRIKRGTLTHKRHKKILKDNKGYRGKSRTTIKLAKIRRIKAGVKAYIDRKTKKRLYRRLWTVRLNAAVRPYGMSYSRFVNGLTKAKISLNRLTLSELAIHHPDVFKQIVEIAKAAL